AYLNKPASSGLVMLGMPSTPRAQSVPTAERDPVCGMNVNPATAKHVHEHDGKKNYFCSAGCLEKFKANPEKYRVAPASPAEVHSPRSALESQKPEAASPVSYVCPMCPEVREPKPRACPSCGMALEKDVPTASTRTEYT